MAIIDNLTCSKSLHNPSQNTEIIDRFTRSRWLFGESFKKLQNAKVLVCGCGGVGGAVIECLYRSGAVNLSVIDCDKFDITNQNRQLGSENLNDKKCEVFAKKFNAITPIFAKIDDEFLENFDISKFDFVIDAIDDIRAKIALAKLCYKKNVKFISSLGAAKRLDPTKIKIASIWKTHNDPFAKKIRYELKKSGFKGDFKCVFSEEEPKCEKLGSFMGVTASFGLTIASFVVSDLIKT